MTITGEFISTSCLVLLLQHANFQGQLQELDGKKKVRLDCVNVIVKRGILVIKITGNTE